MLKKVDWLKWVCYGFCGVVIILTIGAFILAAWKYDAWDIMAIFALVTLIIGIIFPTLNLWVAGFPVKKLWLYVLSPSFRKKAKAGLAE